MFESRKKLSRQATETAEPSPGFVGLIVSMILRKKIWKMAFLIKTIFVIPPKLPKPK
jgi:hypothetical protein